MRKQDKTLKKELEKLKEKETATPRATGKLSRIN